MKAAAKKIETVDQAILYLAKKCLKSGMSGDQIENFFSAGYAPQVGSQQTFHVAARRADRPGAPRFLLIEGNRGGGKTQAAMMQVIADDCQRRPGLRVLLLRKVSLALQEQMEAKETAYIGKLSCQFARSRGVLQFPTGSTVRLGHFQDERQIDRFLGQEYDVILIEELTQLTQWKFADILSCLRTSKLDWRPRLYATTNPDGIGFAWVRRLWIPGYEKFYEEEDPQDYLSIRSDLRENRFLDPVEYRKNLGLLTGSRRKAWIEGSWEISTGQFFENFSRKRIVEPAPKQPSLHWELWGAYDYGWTHPGAWLSFGEDGNRTIHTLREWGMPRQTLRQQAATVAAWPEAKRWRYIATGADCWATKANDAGLTIAEKLQTELREAGITAPLRPAPMDRIQGWAEMNARMGEPDNPGNWRIVEGCYRLLETLEYLEHDLHHAEDVLKVNADERGEGGDDFADAARYGLMSRAGSTRVQKPEKPGNAPRRPAERSQRKWPSGRP